MIDRQIVREEQKRAFLNAAGLAHAAREPLLADASTRRYERLRLPSGATLMSITIDFGWSPKVNVSIWPSR